MKINDLGKMINIQYWKVLAEIKRKPKCKKGHVAKHVNIVYPQCFNIIDRLKDIGLVKIDKEGRSCFCSLTKQGEGVCKMVDFLHKIPCKK